MDAENHHDWHSKVETTLRPLHLQQGCNITENIMQYYSIVFLLHQQRSPQDPCRLSGFFHPSDPSIPHTQEHEPEYPGFLSCYCLLLCHSQHKSTYWFWKPDHFWNSSGWSVSFLLGFWISILHCASSDSSYSFSVYSVHFSAHWNLVFCISLFDLTGRLHSFSYIACQSLFSIDV